MKNFRLLYVTSILALGAGVAMILRPVVSSSREDLLAGEEVNSAKQMTGGKSRDRATGNIFDRSTELKLEKFFSLVSESDPNSKEATRMIEGIPLTLKKIDFIIDGMGREGAIRYLEGFEGEFQDSEVGSIIYGRFIEREINDDYVAAIDVIDRVGVLAVYPNNFSSLLANAIIADDEGSLDLISEKLLARNLWSRKVNATLLEKILNDGSSYKEAFGTLQKIDPSGVLLQVIAVEYLKGDSVLLDLNSDDGAFVLSYLNGLDIFDKDEVIELFVSRNSGSDGAAYEK